MTYGEKVTSLTKALRASPPESEVRSFISGLAFSADELISLLRDPEITRFPKRNKIVASTLSWLLVERYAGELKERNELKSRLRSICALEVLHGGRAAAIVLAKVYMDLPFFRMHIGRKKNNYHRLLNMLYGLKICLETSPPDQVHDYEPDAESLLWILKSSVFKQKHKEAAAAILNQIFTKNGKNPAELISELKPLPIKTSTCLDDCQELFYDLEAGLLSDDTGTSQSDEDSPPSSYFYRRLLKIRFHQK